MIKIGITGSIGMGKSTTARIFEEIACVLYNSDKGCSLFDSDKAVHELYEGRAVPIVKKEFPSSVTKGRIDRKKLGELVIGNTKNMKKLEEIIHPLVRDETLKFFVNSKNNGVKMAVVDIPLLFETGAEKIFDFVVVAMADSDIQRKRVLSREGMTEQIFENILSRQIPTKEKEDLADYLVDTGKGMTNAVLRVLEIIVDIIKKRGQNQ